MTTPAEDRAQGSVADATDVDRAALDQVAAEADPSEQADAPVDDDQAAEPSLEDYDPEALAAAGYLQDPETGQWYDPTVYDDAYADVLGEGQVNTRRRTPQGVVQVVGRRKGAVARVRIVPGSGSVTINGKVLSQYFPSPRHQQTVQQPFATLERTEAYDVVASITGGGVSGQAGALRLGIARGLVELDASDRDALKKDGLLTRDARVKERRKYGLKKARKAPQYSKR